MTNTLATPLNIAAAGLLAAATIAGFVLIEPGAMLPVHWNIAGEVDMRHPRDFALLILPAIAVLIGAVFLLVGRLGARGRVAAGGHLLGAALTALLILFFAVQAAIVLIGVGIAVDMVRVVCVGMAVLLVILGNAMPKSQPNSFAGLRIPSTLNDPANWQATHRLTGRLLMLGGLVLAGAAVVLSSSPLLLAILLLALLGPLLAGTVYSLRLARRTRAT